MSTQPIEPLISLAWEPLVTSVVSVAAAVLVKRTLFDVEVPSMDIALLFALGLAVPHAADQFNLTAEWQSDIALAAAQTVVDMSSPLPYYVNFPSLLFSRTLGRGIARFVFGAKSDVKRFYFA